MVDKIQRDSPDERYVISREQEELIQKYKQP